MKTLHLLKNSNPDIAKQLRYIEKLRKGIVRVNSQKADGTGREMYCTRNSDYIFRYITNENHVGMDNEENIKKDLDCGCITVFDCEKKEFRRFKVSSLHSTNGFKVYSYNIDTKLPNELMKDVYKVFYNKQKELLENFVVKVIFRKANGDDRILYGTRNIGFINKIGGNLSFSEFDDSEELSKDNYVMSLFDLEKMEVRRYKLSRLLDFKLVDVNCVRGVMTRKDKFESYEVEERMLRNSVARGFNGNSFDSSEFKFLVLDEEMVKDCLISSNVNDFVSKIATSSAEFGNELKGLFNFSSVINSETEEDLDFVKDIEDELLVDDNIIDNSKIKESSENSTSGKVVGVSNEISFTLTLDNLVNGVEIKSMQVVGNEVKFILNVK